MLWFKVAEGADGAGELADAEVFSGGVEAVRLRCISEYQSRSLRPKVVGSAWTPWVRPMMGVCWNSSARRFERGCEREDAGADEGGGFAELEGLRGVDYVGGGEAVVQPARDFSS